MRVWKWSLRVASLQSLPIPKNAEILTVQLQDNIPCLWALVDETAPIEYRSFAIYGTGEPISNPGKYIGTFQLGALVFHVFELPGS